MTNPTPPPFADVAQMTPRQIEQQRAEYRLQRLAEIRKESIALRLDQTVPGGRYQGVDGKLHDAEGNPVP